jgi:WD40 repeat protein
MTEAEEHPGGNLHLSSPTDGSTIKPVDEAPARIEAEHGARARKRSRTRYLAALLALIFAGGAAWHSREAQRREVLTLTAAADRTTQRGVYEIAIKTAMQGLPRQGGLPLFSLGWDTPEIRGLEAKLAGAAQASALRAIFGGHDNDSVNGAAFSPDGSRIVTASHGNTARVWDVKSGAVLLVLQGHGDDVYRAAFSPDGSRIVTASADHTARVWDAKSGEALLTLHYGDVVYRAAFSPDGTRIVTTSQDKIARVWDAQSGEVLLAFGSADEFATKVAGADGSHILVTSYHERTARVWDTRGGNVPLPLEGRELYPFCAAVSQDGARAVIVSIEDNGEWNNIALMRDWQVAKVWDVKGGKALFSLQIHDDQVKEVAFSPDGSRIVTVGRSRLTAMDTMQVWDAQTGKALIAIRGYIDNPSFSPDSSRIVAESWGGARLWDAQSRQPMLTLRADDEKVTSAAFSPDGLRAVTSSGKTARVWDVQSGQVLLTLQGHDGQINSAAFSRDGSRVVTAAADHTARVWDAQTGKALLTLEAHASFLGAAFSPDGSRIATAFLSVAEVWDAKSGGALLTLDHEGWLTNSVAFSPDSSRIVTASDDGSARVWNGQARQGQYSEKALLMLWDHRGRVRSAAFSQDGSRIVTASDDNTARIWDANSGEALLTLAGHGGRLNGAAFSPDGSRIITASDDGTARVWDTVSGEVLLTFEGHDGKVNSAVFSPDGTRILTASDDGAARVWDAQWLVMHGPELVQRACQERLVGGTQILSFYDHDYADVFTDKAVPHFYGDLCARRGPLSLTYWKRLAGWK